MKFDKLTPKLKYLKIDFSGIYVAVYLYQGVKNILIDSGLNDSNVDEFIVPGLKNEGLTLNDIDMLLCTHTHGDHLGGHHRIKELNPLIKVVATDLQKDKLIDPLKYNILIRKTFPEDSAPPSKSLKGVDVDIVVKENDKIESLQYIYTPGHDNDCVSILETESGYLLTGDSIQQNGTNTQGMALYMYLNCYIESIKKLKNLKINAIVCGHPFNPQTNIIKGERQVQKFLDDELVLIDEYSNFIKERKNKDIHEVAVELINHLNGIIPNNLFLALYTVREHLNKLKEEYK